MQIVIENEDPRDDHSLFRIVLRRAKDGHASATPNIIAEGLTAAQSHIVVGELLQRFLARGTSAKPTGRTSL